jgi:hypothetical protein
LEPQIKALTPIVAIVGLVVIEIIALDMGTDGIIFTTVCAIIAGLGGYKLKANLPALKALLKTGTSPKPPP